MKMNNKIKSIKYNFIMNAILAMASVIFPLITFPYITRVLLPEGTGKIAFANSIVSYFSMFAMLGIPTYGIRACAQVRDDKEELSKIVHEIWGINVIITVFVLILFCIAINTIPALKNEHTLMMICGLTIIFNMIGMEWLYKGVESYSYITIRSLLFKAAGVILMILMVHKQSDYLIYAGIAVLSNSGYGILNFIHARKYITFNRLSGYNFKRHLKPVATFFAMSVAVAVYTNLDVAMLGFLKDAQEVGYYDVAVKMKVILVNLVTALGAVILPRASYYVKKNKNEDFYNMLSKAFELVLFISVPLTIYFIVMAKESIMFLSGYQYLKSVAPMQIIMPTLIIIGFSNLLGIQILIPMGKEKVVIASEITGAVADIILNAVLIPELGALGAAVGTLAAELMVLGVQYICIRKIIPPVWKNMQKEKILIAVLISFAILMIIKLFFPLWLFGELVITALGFFGLYGLILYYLKEPMAIEIISMIKSIIYRRK